MDRERYQSFFDVVRLTSVRIMMCLRAAYGGKARMTAGRHCADAWMHGHQRFLSSDAHGCAR